MSRPDMQSLIATFFFVAYGFLTLVAICGSISIAFIILRYRNLRSRPINFYYMNMAAADLFLAIFGAPFRALYYLNMRWTFGSFGCHWFEYAENLAYFVHVYSLMIGSFLVLQDVMLVRHSYRRSIEEHDTCLRSYVVSSFGVWTFGILVCLPYVTYRHYRNEQCISLDDPIFFLPEKVFGPLVLIVVPITVTIITILIIICCACSASRNSPKNATARAPPLRAALLRAQKSTRHISLLMLIYILCQVPYFSLKWLDFNGRSQHDTLQICSAGLRLACACFSAAFFCYISDEKVLYNVQHVIRTLEKRQGRDGHQKMPRSVSDTQYREVATATPTRNGTLQRDQPETYV